VSAPAASRSAFAVGAAVPRPTAAIEVAAPSGPGMRRTSSTAPVAPIAAREASIPAASGSSPSTRGPSAVFRTAIAMTSARVSSSGEVAVEGIGVGTG